MQVLESSLDSAAVQASWQSTLLGMCLSGCQGEPAHSSMLKTAAPANPVMQLMVAGHYATVSAQQLLQSCGLHVSAVEILF